MNRLCCLLLLISVPAIAQQPAQNPAPQPAITIRSSARLVLLDVVVQDRENRPIHGLKREDFTVTDAGAPQTLTAFQEHVALSPDQAAKFQPLPKLPPGVFTNFTPVPANSSVNVLLLDSLNTPILDQNYVRLQLLDYLKHARPGTRVAIFSLTTRLSLLQGFTSDPELLRQLAEKKFAKASPLLEDQVGQQPQESLTDLATSFGMPMTADVSAALGMMQQAASSLKLDIRAKITLEALNLLARYLTNIPGRKNLIWFSGSFPVNLVPTSSGSFTDPFEREGDQEEMFRETINLLARNQVAVYPIDARGIQVSPNFDLANASPSGLSGLAAQSSERAFAQQNYSEHDTMQRLASGTGGHAFYNVNNLSRAMDMAMQDGSNYYTLEYIPTPTDNKAAFRKIQVKLAEKGYTLTYRPGYFTDDSGTRVSATTAAPDAVGPSDPVPAAKPAAKPAAPKLNPVLQQALTHGYPAATEILYKLLVQPSSAKPVDALGQHRKLSDQQEFSIDFAAVTRDITFTVTHDGMHHATIEFISMVYNPDGKLINIVSNVAQANVDAAHFADMQRTGIHYHQEIGVPVLGQFSIRTAIHDVTSNRLGVIELPVSLVKNLPPAVATNP
jgi:VWFA-related protein